MKTIEEEAEQHWSMTYMMAKDESIKPYVVNDFIAGANSKWAQVDKIKAQIDVLKPIVAEGYKLKAHHNNPEWKKQLETSEQKLIELKQQLKQLEDENN